MTYGQITDETDEMDEHILISDWIHGLGCL